MNTLSALLRGAFPFLDAGSRCILEGIARRAGELPSADTFATELGFTNRHQVARILTRAGLPPLEQLAAWSRLLLWLVMAEVEHKSLSQMALEAERDPAVCYRQVRQLTGRVWSEVLQLGPGWVVQTLLVRYRPMGESAAIASRPGARGNDGALNRRSVPHGTRSPA
jgi:hypothetical protein